MQLLLCARVCVHTLLCVCFVTGVYTPGVVTDVVREVKEAARVREEALLSRVRALVEERSWSMSESNIKMMRDLEEMKVSVRANKCAQNWREAWFDRL